MNKVPSGLDAQIYKAIMKNIPLCGSINHDGLVSKTMTSLGNGDQELKIRETIVKLLDRSILREDTRGNIVLNK